jgi:hypothetical protein
MSDILRMLCDGNSTCHRSFAIDGQRKALVLRCDGGKSTPLLLHFLLPSLLTHFSVFISQYSFLSIHFSCLIFHFSFFIFHFSFFIFHFSFFIFHFSFFIFCLSYMNIHIITLRLPFSISTFCSPALEVKLETPVSYFYIVSICFRTINITNYY